jgi:hypothetical protein
LRAHTEKHNTSHMRTKTLLLTAALAAAGAAATQAADVYSVNSVGYANVTVPTGFSAIACPFEQTSADYSLNTLLPAGLPNLQDASMYIFNNGHFLPPMLYDEVDGWDVGPNGPLANLNLGSGGFLLSPRATSVTFVGQVKQSINGASIDNSYSSGFSIRSSMIPQAATLNNLALFGSLTAGDPNDPLQDASIYHFNITTSPHRYDPPALYDATDKWDPDYSLRIGEAFLLLAPRNGAIKRVFTVN